MALSLVDSRRIVAFHNDALHVPDFPILPFIEGDGIGADIWRASVQVFDAAVQKAYGYSRLITWYEVYAGEKARQRSNTEVPVETIEAFKDLLVGIKGPLATPVGKGIRSINVSLRQQLDLYACVRPIRYFPGVTSPVKSPQDVNMVVFRENTEDLYAGMEFKAGTEEADALKEFLMEFAPDTYKKIRFPNTTSFGFKPVSREGTERLMRAAVQYAQAHGRSSVTIVHKGNIMKFTEGAFRDWAYDLVKREFGGMEIIGGKSWLKLPDGLVVKDVIADAFFQDSLLTPKNFDVVATLNLNGDLISDALAAQVGGVGISPGANINYQTGAAIFEATHGTAPDLENLDQANPSSLILSGAMMFNYLGWNEAAVLIEAALARVLAAKMMTRDLARFVPEGTKLSCSQFAQRIIAAM